MTPFGPVPTTSTHNHLGFAVEEAGTKYTTRKGRNP